MNSPNPRDSMRVHAGAALLGAALLASGASACADDSGIGGAGGVGAAGGDGGADGTAPSSSSGVNLTSTSSTGLPPAFSVTGVVIDQDGAPVAGAVALQGGKEIQMTTGANGEFELELTSTDPGTPTAVAAKTGYRSAGLELTSLPGEPIELMLYIVEPPDNTGYDFRPPGVGDPEIDNSTLFCGHCHTTLTAQFQTSGHARATRNPLLQDLYAGAAFALADQSDCEAAGGLFRQGAVPGAPGDTADRCYVGDGVLPDLNGCGGPGMDACDDPAISPLEAPDAFGACADCHALAMDGPAGGRNLLEADALAHDNGNHCDACHHVRDIDLDAPAGNAGRLVMQRPREKLNDEIDAPVRQALFGPYPDVPNGFMGGSWQPKFSTAEFCAGCHLQLQPALLPGATLAPRFASGLPTHSTFTEWQEGPFAASDTHCQSCHMPQIDDLFNVVDVSTPEDSGIAGGFARAPEKMRAHTFRGPLTQQPAVPRLIDNAVEIDIVATPIGSSLQVDLLLTNVACGHAIPTGEPMRSLVLVVEVEGCAQRFTPLDGMTIPDFGGALASGIAGAGVTIAGTTVAWPDGAALAQPGFVVRVVRPSSAFWDYDGIGLFEGSTLSPAEKGMPISDPVGEAVVVSVNAGAIELDNTLTVAAGDVVYLGEPTPPSFADGDLVRALAGAPGAAFGRIIVDPAGRRHVPHYRGVDIASDNRIGPGREASTNHSFEIPAGCLDASVTATLVYRPLPLEQARERAWEARDYIVSIESLAVTLP